MLCQKCGKNEADVQFIQTINGERTEAMLCGKCASESGFTAQISFTNFLQGFLEGPPGLYQKESAKSELVCDGCGTTLREIRSTGKTGCAQCYSVFKRQIEAIIKNAQAGNVHTGKFPQKAGYIAVAREIGQLRRKLTLAVEEERFEDAASLRDAIKKLEGGVSNEHRSE